MVSAKPAHSNIRAPLPQGSQKSAGCDSRKMMRDADDKPGRPASFGKVDYTKIQAEFVCRLSEEEWLAQ